MSASIRVVVRDNLNQTFDPDSCSHAMTYDVHGNMLTDTATESNGAIVRVKTFTYNEIGAVWVVATETQWINVTENWQG